MIQLKGTRGGVLRCVIPEDLTEKGMIDELEELADSAKNFLNGSSIIMDMQGREFSPRLIYEIWSKFLEPAGCSVASWVASDAKARQYIKRIGGHLEGQRALVSSERKGGSSASFKGLLYSGNLRGGQKLEHDGDVIIVGHVNMGAEVNAQGHVVVLGKLKGLVHAGAGGDNSVSISTRSLEAGQVRIGNKVGIIDKDTGFWGKPAIVTVSGDEVLLAEWPAI